MNDASGAPPELHARIRGDDGPALVILHGLFGSANNWNRIARDLAEDHRVVMLDLPNHGQSPHVADMTYPAMARAVIHTLEVHGIDRAHVVGHSMGGKVAMALALLAPERVERLLVADIAPLTYGDRGHGELIRALQGLELARITSRNAATEALASTIPDPGVRQFLLANLEKTEAGFDWRIPLQALADNLPVVAGFPDLSGSFEGPTLFLRGALSDYVPADAETAIRGLFPRATIDELPGAGHWLHAERPDAFTARLRAFLGTATTA